MSHPKTSEMKDFDPLALFKLLLGNFTLIAVITAAFVFAAIAYLQMVSQSYFVRVPYSVDTASIGVDEICNGDLDCIGEKIGDKIVARTDGGWFRHTSRNILSKTTKSPSAIEEYNDYFSNIEKQLSAEYLDEATSELEMIETKFGGDLGDSNAVADAALRANRIIASVNAGKSLVSFQSAYVQKAFPRPFFLVVTAAFTGLLLGAIFVILRDAFVKGR